MTGARQDHPPLSEYSGRSGEILARLQELHPKLIDLSLNRLEILLEKLGHPERHLPPVIHVAGTNGKGSTCAYLRAIAEEAGLRVHVMTSPHLLNVTERFRLAGQLVTEDALIAVLQEIERGNDGAPITVFEVLTAAGLLLFSRVPADLAIVEVGLGGRYDATNVIPSPSACIITSISLDHQNFLGETLGAIAAEKAGIIKPGVPVVTAGQKPEALAAIRHQAAEKKAPLLILGEEITLNALTDGHWRYDDPHGTLELPAPALTGAHQRDNAALAVAALRHSGLPIPQRAFAAIGRATWPGRLQTLNGALARGLPPGWSLLLDGGHNPGAGEALRPVLQHWNDAPLHLIIGLKQSKDAAGFLRPLLDCAATVQAVAEPDQHLAMSVQDIIDASGGVATPGPTVREALARLAVSDPAPRARVLISGSLYLAGVVLAQDGWVPR